MILEMIMNVVHLVFKLLTTPIKLPSLPSGVEESLNYYADFLTGGVKVLGYYFDLSYLLTLFGIVLAVEGGLLLYKMIMWIIRKIPTLSISN